MIAAAGTRGVGGEIEPYSEYVVGRQVRRRKKLWYPKLSRGTLGQIAVGAVVAAAIFWAGRNSVKPTGGDSSSTFAGPPRQAVPDIFDKVASATSNDDMNSANHPLPPGTSSAKVPVAPQPREYQFAPRSGTDKTRASNPGGPWSDYEPAAAALTPEKLSVRASADILDSAVPKDDPRTTVLCAGIGCTNNPSRVRSEDRTLSPSNCAGLGCSPSASPAAAPRHATGDHLAPTYGPSGNGILKLTCTADRDSVVLLVSASSGELAQLTYVRGRGTVQLTGIAPGTYYVRVTQGVSWIDEEGRFLNNASYFEFPHPYKFDEQHKGDRIEYDQIALTLNEVPNGNVKIEQIGAASFWPKGIRQHVHR